MTTKKQMEANRRNAQLSTGPRTSGGRMQSRRNALKHGLTAADVTVDDAEEKAFEAFRDDIVEDLGALGTLEEELAQRFALGLWRLRRVPRLEIARKRYYDSDERKYAEAPVFEFMADGECDNLIRYEVAIDRSMQRTLHELERLQARRRGEAVMAPITVDVSHSIAGSASNSGSPNGNSAVNMGSHDGAAGFIGALPKPLKGNAS